MVTHQKRAPYGSLVDVDRVVKNIWNTSKLEPQLLSGEPVPDLPDESDPTRDRDAKALLAKLLERCTKREVAVLTMRYIHEMTLEEVGRSLHVTNERVRQIEKKAMIRARWGRISDKDVGSFFN